MKQYLELINLVLNEGVDCEDRTGVGTKKVFGAMSKYDLRDGFPLLTTKKVFYKSLIKELSWFLRGSTTTHDLGCGIWDKWADRDGNLGPIYGKQWRAWGGGEITVSSGREFTSNIAHFRLPSVDQIAQVLQAIKLNPQSRRHIVSAWNVTDLPFMALPPCHCLFQFNVMGDRLDLALYQRSADLAIGVPFNIASYALLLAIIANETGLEAGIFTHMFGDLHIYKDHIPGLIEQVQRDPKPLPRLWLREDVTVDSFSRHVWFPDEGKDLQDMVKIIDYQHHPAIKFEVHE